MDWFHSFFYLVCISILAFPIGRMIPKHWLRWDRKPYLPFAWEEEGKIYLRFGIRKWMHKLPDMSKIMTKYMKRKELPALYTEDDVRYLLEETCIAEFVHTMLCLFGTYCIRLWNDIGGAAFCNLYIFVFNLPYIMIQRYNRPRLVRLYKRLQKEKDPVHDTTILKDNMG